MRDDASLCPTVARYIVLAVVKYRRIGSRGSGRRKIKLIDRHPIDTVPERVRSHGLGPDRDTN